MITHSLGFLPSFLRVQCQNASHYEWIIIISVKTFYFIEALLYPWVILIQRMINDLLNNNTSVVTLTLKGRYTFGNCQRPVFSLGVSHHKHKITSLWKFGLNWSSKLRENDERKNTLVGRICVLSDRNKRLLARSLLLF